MPAACFSEKDWNLIRSSKTCSIRNIKRGISTCVFLRHFDYKFCKKWADSFRQSPWTTPWSTPKFVIKRALKFKHFLFYLFYLRATILLFPRKNVWWSIDLKELKNLLKHSRMNVTKYCAAHLSKKTDITYVHLVDERTPWVEKQVLQGGSAP